MGLFKKLKNIFYDEEVVEVQTQEEPKPKVEEVVLPKRDTVIESKKENGKIQNSISERELFKSETTFNFPIFEDEKEENIKVRSRTSSILEFDDTKSKGSVFKEPLKEEHKVFQPSPVISPIYGILDKNYKKEEVTEKAEVKTQPKKDITYNYVRKKAYGTLEDELENTISELSDSKEEENLVNKVNKASHNIEDLLDEIEKTASISIGEIEDKIKKQEEEKEEKNEKTLEHDLFNLIDSMYEEKED